MSGRRPFRELKEGWSAEIRQAVEERTAALLSEIDHAEIAELRKALKISQQELAALLDKSQGAVAQLEQRTDMKISTLRATVEALGGHLKLIAEFPTGEVRLSNMGEAGIDNGDQKHT